MDSSNADWPCRRQHHLWVFYMAYSQISAGIYIYIYVASPQAHLFLLRLALAASPRCHAPASHSSNFSGCCLISVGETSLAAVLREGSCPRLRKNQSLNEIGAVLRPSGSHPFPLPRYPTGVQGGWAGEKLFAQALAQGLTQNAPVKMPLHFHLLYAHPGLPKL